MWTLVPLALLAGASVWGYLTMTARVRAENEWAARLALKAVWEAEQHFRNTDADGNQLWDFWTADLQGLARLRLISPRIAAADASLPEPVPYHGYYFRALVTDGEGNPYATDTSGLGAPRTHHHSQFAFCAYPASYGRTARATLLVNEGSWIEQLDTGGAPVLACPPEFGMTGPWGYEK